MAVSPDQFRVVYFQGHPEYDFNSLMKEYLREVRRFLNDELDTPPPFPENYLSDEAQQLAKQFVDEAVASKAAGRDVSDTLEQQISAMLDNTWGDTAKALINNWLGLVYQLTNLDRRQQFMEGVDPQDPLGLHAQNK